MKCFNCKEENWHLLEKEFTGWPERQMGICKVCGTIAYQVDPAEEIKMKNYYRHEYRTEIGVGNLITTSRKRQYFKNFIKDWLLDQEKQGRQLTVCDIGCSTGYLVDFFRQRNHKATGSEWTIGMRRFAEHFYGIPVTEEPNASRKYDLLVLYHVFEHMIEPDKKLDSYLSLLNEGGHLVISVPEWMDVLDESGSGKVQGFKELFHKDHINVFTVNSLKRLFNEKGLAIVKEDRLTYGQTYLLRKRLPTESLIEIKDEPWQETVEKLGRLKKAIEFYRGALDGRHDSNFREALNQWPKFPDVYYDWILNSTQKKDRGRCAELLEEGFKLMPNDIKMHVIRAYFLYQNQNYPAALEDFEYACQTKMNEDILMYRGYCYDHLGRKTDAMRSFHEASLLNPQKWTEAMVWMAKLAVDMKSWDEIATDHIKQQLFDQAQVKMAPQDPMFQENAGAKPSSDGLISNGNGISIEQKPEMVPSDAK